MNISDFDPCAPEDAWDDPTIVPDLLAGADAPEQDTTARFPVAEWTAPAKSATDDTLQDVLIDVWVDAGRPLDSYRKWWENQLAYWSDHAQYKLRRGKDGHLHAHQGSDIVAKVFERMAARVRDNDGASDSLPPRRWGAFRMYMYTAVENMCQDLGDLVRVSTCSAPWERYSDSDEDGHYWSPADTSPESDPHASRDAELLGDLIREHTTDTERELLLYLWGGHTAASIAEATGGKREAVKRRITRLRARLQPILVDHGYARPVESEFRNDREPLRSYHNVGGIAGRDVPGQPCIPLCKIEGRIRLPRVDRVPVFLPGSTDVKVKTDAPVTVRFATEWRLSLAA